MEGRPGQMGGQMATGVEVGGRRRGAPAELGAVAVAAPEPARFPLDPAAQLTGEQREFQGRADVPVGGGAGSFIARPGTPRPAGPRRTRPAGSRHGPAWRVPTPGRGHPEETGHQSDHDAPEHQLHRRPPPLARRAPAPLFRTPAASTRPGHRLRVRARCDRRTARRARTTSARPPGPAPGPPGPSPGTRPRHRPYVFGHPDARIGPHMTASSRHCQAITFRTGSLGR